MCPFANYLKNIEPRNVIFCVSLPCDLQRKAFKFEQDRPGVRVGVGSLKFWSNDTEIGKKNFQAAITVNCAR